jgi:hypothetical protein
LCLLVSKGLPPSVTSLEALTPEHVPVGADGHLWHGMQRK